MSNQRSENCYISILISYLIGSDTNNANYENRKNQSKHSHFVVHPLFRVKNHGYFYNIHDVTKCLKDDTFRQFFFKLHSVHMYIAYLHILTSDGLTE